MKKESRKFVYLGLIFSVVWILLSIFLSALIRIVLNAIIPEKCNYYGYYCTTPIETPEKIISIIIKFIIWLLFAIYFIKKYNKDLDVPKEKLLKLNNIKFLIILIITTVIGTIFAMLNNHGGFNINKFTVLDFFDKFLIIGVEELVFRGLILNGLMKNNTYFKATLVTSGLFALIHISSFIKLYIGLESSIIYAVKLFFMSLIFDYIFKKTKSICHVTVFHSLWDFMFYLFVE